VTRRRRTAVTTRKLLPGQQQNLLAAYAALREMIALVGADQPMEAEPAHIFVPDDGAERRP
jgi:hypothetical protein